MREDLLNMIVSSIAEELKKEEEKKEASKESTCDCDCCKEDKCDCCEGPVNDSTVSIDYNVYEDEKALTFAFNIPLAKEFITLEHKLGMIRVTTAAPTKDIGKLVSDANISLLEYDGETVVEIPDTEYFDTSKISASFENGILWVTVPRSKNSVARTIEIK